MKSRPAGALGIGAGYLLGRTRKMRLALMVAGVAATGALGDAPRQLMQRGKDKLASSPELSNLTDGIRGDLLTAAKSAAMVAASNRIDSLSDRLREAGAPPQPEEAPEEAPEEETEEALEEAPEQAEAEAPEEEEPEADEEPAPEERPRRRQAKKSTASKRPPVRRTGR